MMDQLQGKQKKVFEMTLVIMNALVPCDVYIVQETADIAYTRVIMHPGTSEERTWDLDKEDYCDNPEDPDAKWSKQWVDIYDGHPGRMVQLLGAAVDAKIREQKNENL